MEIPKAPRSTAEIAIEALGGLMEQLETRVENQEVLIHSLLSAYLELWAMMNVVVQKFLEGKSEEDEKTFMKHFQETKNNIWSEVGKVAKHDFSSMDPDTASAVEEYIKTQQRSQD